MKWLEKPIELLTGYDVFISYSHRHAISANYAPALAECLQEKGLDCHIDQWGSKADERIPEFLKWIIRRSRVLVVLGSPPANESSAIEEEIQCFKENHDTIVPVELDGVMHDARWWKELKGLIPISDPQGAGPDRPSSQVIQRIVNSCMFTRARKRRKIAILTAGSVILVALIALAVLFFYLGEAREQQALAQQARNRAVTLSLGSTALQTANSTDGRAVELGLLLAAESYRRDPNAVAFLAIRHGLSLLPRPAGNRRILSRIPDDEHALSPDGTRLILEQYHDNQVKIIDTADGRSVGSIPGASLRFERAFSPDGQYFVAPVEPEEGAPDDTDTLLQLVSLAQGRPKGRPVSISGNIYDVALGPSGDTFAACVQQESDEDLVRTGVWQTDRRKDQFIPVKGSCTALTISPDGRHVAIGVSGPEADERVVIWDTQAKVLRKSFPMQGRVEQIIFSSDSRLMAAVSEGARFEVGKNRVDEPSQLHVWKLEGEPQRALPVIPIDEELERIHFSRDDDNWIVLLYESSLLVLDSSGTVVRRMGWEKEAEIVDVSLAAKRMRLLLRHPDEDYESFDFERLDYSIAPATVRSLAIPRRGEGDVLAMSAFGSRVYLNKGKEVVVFDRSGARHAVALEFKPTLLSLSPDESRFLVCGVDDENLHLALIDNASLTATWKDLVNTETRFEIESASTSDNGVVAVTLSIEAEDSSDNTYIFDTRAGAKWSFRSGSPPDPDSYSWPGVPDWSPGEVRVSADGKQVILDDGEFDVATGRRIAKRRQQEPSANWFGGYPLSSDSISSILASNTPGRAGRVAVSKDCEFIAIAGSDSGINVFRTSDGEPIARINERASLVTFSSDGRWLLGAGDPVLKGWLFKREDLLPEVARSVTRNLSDDEIKRYIRGEPYVPLLRDRR